MGYGDALGNTMQGAGAGAAFGPIGAGAGALLGLGKYFLIDRPSEERNRTLAAETARYSPWTHMTPQIPGQSDPFGNVMAFGATGAGIAQQADQNAQSARFNDKYLEHLDLLNKKLDTPNYNFGTTGRDPMAEFWSQYGSENLAGPK